MTYTFYEATRDLARLLQIARDGIASAAGTTATLIDAAITEPNDYFNGGTIWGLMDSSGSPTEYHVGVISDYASATHTLTFAPAYTATFQYQEYTAASEKFPLHVLRTSVLRAMRDVGPVVCEKTFVSTGAQTYLAYTYAGGVWTASTVEIDEQLLGIEVATQTGEPYDWKAHRNWRTEAYLTAGHKQLIFDTGHEPAAGMTIRLIYTQDYVPVITESDYQFDNDVQINPDIQRDWLSWAAAVHAWRWRMSRVKGDEPEAKEKYQEAMGMAAQMDFRHRKRRAPLANFARW